MPLALTILLLAAACGPSPQAGGSEEPQPPFGGIAGASAEERELGEDAEGLTAPLDPEEREIGEDVVRVLDLCGDGVCDAAQGENCSTCPGDCLDGVCDVAQGDTCSTCPQDCAAWCGDGTCSEDETMATCVADCTTDTCGNGACDPGEDGYTCPKDCFSPGLCGNHWCDSLENYANCPSDCSACWACGNLHVDPGEECDQGGCPTGQACHACQCVIPICGDGWVYSPTEDCEYPAYCDAGEVCQACECVSPGAGSQPPPPPGPVPPPPGDDPCAEPGVTVETFDVFNCTYDYDSAVWTACEGKRCTTASGERVFDGCVGDTYELDQWVPFCPPGPGEDGGSDDGSDGCGGAAAC